MTRTMLMPGLDVPERNSQHPKSLKSAVQDLVTGAYRTVVLLKANGIHLSKNPLISVPIIREN